MSPHPGSSQLVILTHVGLIVNSNRGTSKTVFEVDPVFPCVYLLLYATCLSWCSSCNRSVLCTFPVVGLPALSTLYFVSKVPSHLYPLPSPIHPELHPRLSQEPLHLDPMWLPETSPFSVVLTSFRWPTRSSVTRRYFHLNLLLPPFHHLSLIFSSFLFFASVSWTSQQPFPRSFSHSWREVSKSFSKKKKMLRLHGFNLHGETVAITSRIIDDLERRRKKESEEVDEKSSFEEGRKWDAIQTETGKKRTSSRENISNENDEATGAVKTVFQPQIISFNQYRNWRISCWWRSRKTTTGGFEFF